MKLNMEQNQYKGKLITFCGLDGCGKTTLIDELREYLLEKGKTVFLTKQPTDFVRNTVIFRNFMDEPDNSKYNYRSLSLLCASDRVQHSSEVIAPKLEEGYVVISDRYFYSCLANLHARGYENDKWIYEISKYIVCPDIAFFLDVPVSTAVARVRSRKAERERFIDMDLQHKLKSLYKDIAVENGGIVISTNMTKQQSCLQIKEKTDEMMMNSKLKARSRTLYD